MKGKFLAAFILSSESPGKLAKFYKDKLELPLSKRGETEDFSCMVGETHFAIHKTQKGKSPTQNAEIGLQISDLDNFVKQLEASGVEIVDPIKEYPWARSAQIRDPEGNVVYLMQVPETSIREIKTRLSKELSQI